MEQHCEYIMTNSQPCGDSCINNTCPHCEKHWTQGYRTAERDAKWGLGPKSDFDIDPTIQAERESLSTGKPFKYDSDSLDTDSLDANSKEVRKAGILAECKSFLTCC
jgi:hypothetical protein